MTNSKEQTLIKSSKIWIVDPVAFSRFCYQYGLSVSCHGLNRSSFFGFNSLIISSVFVTDLFKQFDKSREQIVKITINYTDVFQGTVETIKTTQYVFSYKIGQQLTLETYELTDSDP